MTCLLSFEGVIVRDGRTVEIYIIPAYRNSIYIKVVNDNIIIIMDIYIWMDGWMDGWMDPSVSLVFCLSKTVEGFFCFARRNFEKDLIPAYKTSVYIKMVNHYTKSIGVACYDVIF